MLHRHGYGVLITSVRAHYYSDGKLITFGVHELGDLDAWYTYLLTRNDIDSERIGILGNSTVTLAMSPCRWASLLRRPKAS